MVTATKTGAPVLKRLYAGTTIVVGPTTGEEMLADSGDIFTNYVSPIFREWGTDVPGDPTKETNVSIWEVAKNVTFHWMFGSLGNPEELCLTQGQIRKFVVEHRDKLHPKGRATFFLFRVREEFFVAYVCDVGCGLEARVDRFDYSFVWSADCRRRVVVPQLD